MTTVKATRQARIARASLRLLLASCLGLALVSRSAAETGWQEPPFFQEMVSKGDLPPITDRLPADPLETDMPSSGRETGAYGGTLRVIEGQARDTRRMVVFGYARLVGYTPDGKLLPDIARAVDVEDGRIFTFHLRKGHRWSDGSPFTADDFRYYWEDVANDKDLGRNGLPRELLVEGQGPQVSFPDAETVRYAWEAPNPFFLPALAGALPLYIFRPAHYLKQFHQKYADPAELEARVKASGQRNWVALHVKLDQPYRNDNVDLPTLEPWVLVTRPPSDRFMFRRNPYFHRTDTEGHQLPYIDAVAMTISSTGLIPPKVGAGEADLQANYMTFGNYAFLKRASDRWNYDVLRWKSGKGARVALYPDLTAADLGWRALLREKDFRHALSLAINREDINQAIYYGLATPCNDTVQPASPLFRPEFQQKWAGFDPVEANRLLDGLGLTARGDRGLRLMADGRPLEIVVETAGEESEQVDVLQLVAEDWRRIGVGLTIKTGERDSLSSRLAAGSTIMSVWSGLENGVARASDSPAELAPTNSDQHQWPAWGLHFESGGQLGQEPDMPFAQDLLRLNDEWRRTLSEADKTRIWEEMLAITAEETPRIGIVCGVDQIVVASRRLHNFPASGVYNWSPGAFFGTYRPDTFFFSDEPRPDRQAAGKS